MQGLQALVIPTLYQTLETFEMLSILNFPIKINLVINLSAPN